MSAQKTFEERLAAVQDMTYPQYRAYCLKEQRKANREDQARMKEALKLWQRYSGAMLAIGLHPLTREEIEDRIRELHRQGKSIASGGSEFSMKAAYTLHTGKVSSQ
jgi:Tat protein secretion system quality control protein TatD with DNase activity